MNVRQTLADESPALPAHFEVTLLAVKYSYKDQLNQLFTIQLLIADNLSKTFDVDKKTFDVAMKILNVETKISNVETKTLDVEMKTFDG